MAGRRRSRYRLWGVLVSLVASTALAQDTNRVLVRPLPNGLMLDAGSGPKTFVCKAGKVTHQLKVGTRTINTVGSYLTLTLEDQTFRMEMAEKVFPLQPNQVRLSCKGERLEAKFGDLIMVSEW